ncbi:MAG TPA: hypothetical protein VF733_01470 [Candidatus Saccharimonadales bacterium]
MGDSTSDSYQLDINDERSAPNRVLADKDFVMLYPSAAQDASLDQAILALLYLPPQFKLKILTDAADAQRLASKDFDTVRSRVTVESAPSAGAIAFSHIDALVYGQGIPVGDRSHMPHVVISNEAESPLVSNDGSFTVSSDSPEALASAMLRIARATS